MGPCSTFGTYRRLLGIYAVTILTVLAGCQLTEEQEWARVNREGTERSFRQFAREYSGSSKAVEANKLADHLQVVKEDRAYQLARSGGMGSRTHLLRYLSKYPNGRHVDDVNARLEGYRLESAKRIGSEAALSQFLVDYPGGEHALAVQRLLDAKLQEARARKLKSEHNKRFTQALKSRDYNVVRSFLDDYPNSPRTGRIRQRLRKFNEIHTSAPVVVSYESMGWREPATTPKVVEELNSRTRLRSWQNYSDHTSTVARELDILILQPDELLPGMDKAVDPPTLRFKRLAGKAFEVEAIEGKFLVRDYAIILPMDTRLELGPRWIHGMTTSHITVTVTPKGLVLDPGAVAFVYPD